MDATVIIPAYKFEPYISQAIQSVLVQKTTYQFEVLICDDASPDNTKDVVQDLLTRMNAPAHVKYIRHEQNMGMMGNLRNAFVNAKGKYIFICEGDDYWTSIDKLDLQCKLLDEYPDIILSMHNGHILLENGQITEASVIDIEKTQNIADLIDDNTPTASMAFRRELIDPYPDWFDKLLAFDRAIKIVASDRGKVHYSPEKMCVYRKHKDGYWTGRSFQNMFLTSCLNLSRINKGTRGKHSEILQAGIQKRIRFLTMNMSKKEKWAIHITWWWIKTKDVIRYQ